jgi:2-hydroxychromene-2-carboxylate isomerase
VDDLDPDALPGHGAVVSPRDRIARRLMPRAIVALSTVRAPHRAAARVRRLLRRQARVQLFVAFDDASSAVALLGLAARTAGRRAELAVEPVVRRGIPGDPAAQAKREYAVLDAQRLARRDGLTLSRREPLAAQDTAFLAGWASALPRGARRTAFSVAAMRRLWCETEGPVAPGDFAALWSEHGEGEPPAGDVSAAAGERGMRRRRLYDTPVAVVHGQWFFAHERLAQIEHRLAELGWTAA